MTMTTRTLSVPSPPDLVFELAMPDGYAEVIADDIDHVEITLEASVNGSAARAIADATLTTRGSAVRLNLPASGRDTVTVISRHTVVTGTVTGLVIDGAGTVILGDGAVVAGRGDVRATIRLPRGSNLRVKTRSARVLTCGSLGIVVFDSVSGTLDVAEAHALSATTKSGDVRASKTDTASVQTVSGNIRMGLTTVAVLGTTSGDISIRDFGGSARLTTVSGDITVTATLPGRLCATSTSGSITTLVAHDMPPRALIVEARSVSGRVLGPRRNYVTAR
ncbi:DUF4097 family beta strand repeat-containing protein [Streptosporangium sp. NPDC049376]|uniref:DUF4097 family beta strand repeat-containing protein n=1 Tax=Streptosporangium sp. NPDC049376 TaxID=3366192 RepID=UPI0037B4B0BF